MFSLFNRKILAVASLSLTMLFPLGAAPFNTWNKQLMMLFTSSKSATPAAEKLPEKSTAAPAAENLQNCQAAQKMGKNGENSSLCRTLGTKLLWYIPDRCMDLADCFTLEFGFGANIRINLLLTRWIPVGAGAGPTVMIGWNGNREGGIYMRNGVNADFAGYHAADQDQSWIMGNYPNLVDSAQKPLHTQRYRDPLTFGFEGGCIGNAKFMVHLGSIADFIGGIFLIDFQNDDVVNQNN